MRKKLKFSEGKMAEGLFLKDPMGSELGQKIVGQGILLLDDLGMETFTFKKLATEISTTEASIYRYFENKHRFLLYILSLHWIKLQQQVIALRQAELPVSEKITNLISILIAAAGETHPLTSIHTQALHRIVVKESNKAYMTKEVDQDNTRRFFVAYKSLSKSIAEFILEVNQDFRFARSLATSLIELSHLHLFFAEHLPSLVAVLT
jgi:AcrR family transcriptional regulator